MPPDSIISHLNEFKTADSNFIAALALHNARRDSALGITWPGRRTSGLIWYHNKLLAKRAADTARRAFLLGIIQGGKERMAEILKLAPVADKATKKQLLLEAKTIEAAVKNAARALDGKNN